MSDAAVAVDRATGAAAPPRDGSWLVASIALRNLGRNRRRTWLTAGAIGFTIALLAFMRGVQLGSYDTMIDSATALLSGHVQIQRAGYLDDPHIRQTVPNSAALVERVRGVAGVHAATERVMAFVLVSAGEKSFAGQLMGIDVVHEATVSSLTRMIVDGRYLDANANTVEAFLGVALARNLGVAVGDEIVLLGTDATGGVAALAATIVGVFASGQTEIDRGLIELPIAAVREAFALGDESHAIVVRASATSSAAIAASVRGVVTEGEAVLEWQQLVPEVEQAIQLDWMGGQLLFALVALIVTFSIVNTFIMVVFERTREFGVMLAIGTRPRAIIGMLHLEAFWMSLLGVAGGLAVSLPILAGVAVIGIPMGDAGELLAAMFMPDRMYAQISAQVFVPPVVIMLIAAQISAVIPAWRVRRIQPVEALRAT